MRYWPNSSMPSPDDTDLLPRGGNHSRQRQSLLKLAKDIERREEKCALMKILQIRRPGIQIWTR